VLIWLLGDTRHFREDAQLRFRPSGPFGPEDAPVTWEDRCTCDECEIEDDKSRLHEEIAVVIANPSPCHQAFLICA
jgi:hypothetical protein